MVVAAVLAADHLGGAGLSSDFDVGQMHAPAVPRSPFTAARCPLHNLEVPGLIGKRRSPEARLETISLRWSPPAAESAAGGECPRCPLPRPAAPSAAGSSGCSLADSHRQGFTLLPGDAEALFLPRGGGNQAARLLIKSDAGARSQPESLGVPGQTVDSQTLAGAVKKDIT